MTITSRRQQNFSNRAIVQQLLRSVSTAQRELERNSCFSGCASVKAQCRWLQRRRTARPVFKQHPDSILSVLVQKLLRTRWSPQQIPVTLTRLYSKGQEHRVPTETIYNCTYAMPVGELCPDLIACMRHAHKKRVPRSKGQDHTGQIQAMLSIHLRPQQIEDRQFPGHWEGDLIKGEASASAVGTLDESTSGLVMLVKLTKFKPASAANVLQTFPYKLLGIAEPMRLSMTYDQRHEMSMHKKLTQNRGIAMDFFDPYSPWQRGSNEIKNGLVRQYLPKRTDLSVNSQEQLVAIADEISERRRIGLGVRSPMAAYRELLINSPQHSTLIY
jgi:transposase, IS30 family